MARRRTTTIVLLNLLMLCIASFSQASTIPSNESDFSQLLGYIALEDRQDPQIAFGGAEQDFDRRLNRENISYLNQNKALLQQIQSQLDGQPLKWQLSASFKQLLVVPENREAYAHLFERYCKASVAYLLERIHMPSPYEKITTLKEPWPPVPDSAPKGITAYLVHNLVDEYIEEYDFFKADDDQKKIRIKLSNREFDGKVGSVTTRLKIGENNQFEFIREPYTLWQNSARDPLNVLIVPIEETLHLLMRPSTEAAMRNDLARLKPTQLGQVQQIVDDWIAVEEAIVGGVVWQVMPDVLARFVPTREAGQLSQAFAERQQHPQYRLLSQAIQLVADMGIDKSLALYKHDAQDFRELIVPAAPAMESAQGPEPAALIN
jgi:hypothetical protein